MGRINKVPPATHGAPPVSRSLPGGMEVADPLPPPPPPPRRAVVGARMGYTGVSAPPHRAAAELPAPEPEPELETVWGEQLEDTKMELRKLMSSTSPTEIDEELTAGYSDSPWVSTVDEAEWGAVVSEAEEGVARPEPSGADQQEEEAEAEVEDEEHQLDTQARINETMRLAVAHLQLQQSSLGLTAEWQQLPSPPEAEAGRALGSAAELRRQEQLVGELASRVGRCGEHRLLAWRQLARGRFHCLGGVYV
eukprot:COSAG01_NODE_1310_length_10786_cov_26.664265_1_plen_251_part_00